MPEEMTGGEATATLPEGFFDHTDPNVGQPEVETPAPEAPQGDAVPVPVGPTYKVTVDGQELEVTLDEALNGYQRHADYTRKTQELAAQRTELEYAARLAQALEADPARAIDALTQAYQVAQGAPQQQQAQQTPQWDQLDPEQQRFATIEQRLAAQEQAAFERQVNATLAELHQQHGDFEDLDLVKFAVEAGINDLKVAAKAFMFDRALSGAAKAKAEAAAAAAKQTAPPVASGHGVASGAVTDGAVSAKPTIQEALRAAMFAHN